MTAAARLDLHLETFSPTDEAWRAAYRAGCRTYMLALSKDREHRAQWQRAAELLLAEADVVAFSKAVELGLFYDSGLVLAGTA